MIEQPDELLQRIAALEQKVADLESVPRPHPFLDNVFLANVLPDGTWIEQDYDGSSFFDCADNCGRKAITGFPGSGKLIDAQQNDFLLEFRAGTSMLYTKLNQGLFRVSLSTDGGSGATGYTYTASVYHPVNGNKIFGTNLTPASRPLTPSTYSHISISASGASKGWGYFDPLATPTFILWSANESFTIAYTP